MTLDLTKPVQTRGGQPVVILTTTLQGTHPVGGVVRHSHGTEELCQWTRDGAYVCAGPCASMDLVQAPQKIKHTYYANVYKDFCAFHGSRAAAEQWARADRLLDTKEITIEVDT